MNLNRKNNLLRVDVFKSWTPNMAWLLGYIYADGCITVCRTYGGFYEYYRLGFVCKLTDVELVEFIKDFLKASQKIGFHRRKDGCESCSLQIINYELVKDLVELHGLKARKSYLNLPFPNVPDEYLSHFVRGYFDGDGHVSVYMYKGYEHCCVRFVGSRMFLEGVRNSLVEKGYAKSSEVRTHGNIWYVVWYSRRDIRKIYDWLYFDKAVMFLKRKEEIMQYI